MKKVSQKQRIADVTRLFKEEKKNSFHISLVTGYPIKQVYQIIENIERQKHAEMNAYEV